MPLLMTLRDDSQIIHGPTAPTVEHRDDGLCFHTPPSNVDKRKDRAKFDAHHAVLWTKEDFEGDIRISFEFHRIESGWANLVYIQAQGIGTPPYEKDI